MSGWKAQARHCAKTARGQAAEHPHPQAPLCRLGQQRTSSRMTNLEPPQRATAVLTFRFMPPESSLPTKWARSCMWKCLSSSSASMHAASQLLEPPGRCSGQEQGDRRASLICGRRGLGQRQGLCTGRTLEAREEDDVLAGRQVVEEHVCDSGEGQLPPSAPPRVLAMLPHRAEGTCQ